MREDRGIVPCVRENKNLRHVRLETARHHIPFSPDAHIAPIYTIGIAKPSHRPFVYRQFPGPSPSVTRFQGKNPCITFLSLVNKGNFNSHVLPPMGEIVYRELQFHNSCVYHYLCMYKDNANRAQDKTNLFVFHAEVKLLKQHFKNAIALNEEQRGKKT